MRGEKKGRLSIGNWSTGSPPHARGKAPFCGLDNPPEGITPACAGKSKAAERRMNAWQDHPRMRGERLRFASRSPRFRGSPPHARGKEAAHGLADDGERITPACAGKSPAGACAKGAARDHPRMRGEKQ